MTTKQCDLVVVGGGGSGLTAAVRAAQVSGKKVIVLEKSGHTGGGMIMASTMRTFRSKWQEKRGLEDVTDKYLRKVMDDTYWRLDPKLVGNAILATGQFFDWFCDIAGEEVGDRFRVGRYVFDDESGPLGPQMGGPGGVTGGGRLFMDTLRDKCQEYGVEVLTHHRAVDAVVEDGKIKAIVAEGPDGPVQVNCSACVLSIGSWINNDKIVAEICPQFLEAKQHMDPSPHMNSNYTGDGFAIAEKVDAKLDKKNFALRLMGPMVFSKSGVMANMSNSPYTLAINTKGKRYICEPSQIRNGVFNSGLMMMEQPEGYVYILFDRNNLEAAIREEQENPKPPAPGIFGLPPLPSSIEGADEDVKAVLGKEKLVYQADSVEELAKQMGVDPAALQETISNYNRYCEEGFDRDCFKEKEYLVPCNQAPYYAVRAKLGTDGAFGGVLVNGDMQAYRQDGSLIDGLYVTGDFASGRFINMTGVKVQILNDMSWALASGFLAGTNAANGLKD
jgi:fumarate reductase flavoprotein subunit